MPHLHAKTPNVAPNARCRRAEDLVVRGVRDSSPHFSGRRCELPRRHFLSALDRNGHNGGEKNAVVNQPDRFEGGWDRAEPTCGSFEVQDTLVTLKYSASSAVGNVGDLEYSVLG